MVLDRWHLSQIAWKMSSDEDRTWFHRQEARTLQKCHDFKWTSIKLHCVDNILKEQKKSHLISVYVFWNHCHWATLTKPETPCTETNQDEVRIQCHCALSDDYLTITSIILWEYSQVMSIVDWNKNRTTFGIRISFRVELPPVDSTSKIIYWNAVKRRPTAPNRLKQRLHTIALSQLGFLFTTTMSLN